MTRTRYLLIALATIAALAALAWALRPVPAPVDLVEVRAEPMAVTVSAEGKTLVRDPWIVTAPLTGTAERAPVEVGDRVAGGETVVAAIRPAAPALLDARARAQAEAAVAEAVAAVQLGEVNLARAESDLAYAADQLARTRVLAARGTVPQRILDDQQQTHRLREAAVSAASSELDLHRATLDRARALLLAPAESGGEGSCCVEIHAPADGVVLSLATQGGGLVQAGEPLLTIGDLGALEIEVWLLSTDAVRIAPGAVAEIDRWGGEGLLPARVRRIDPAARTRVSALGIEEQRVRVLLDLADSADVGKVDPWTDAQGAGRLGDGFAVQVHITVWAADRVLQVPLGALFRRAGNWAVFRAIGGRAVLTPVTIGQRTDTAAEVLTGLSEGDVVVAYPSQRVVDGGRITSRQIAE